MIQLFVTMSSLLSRDHNYMLIAGEIVLYATNQSSPQSIARVLKNKNSLEQLTSQLTGKRQ